jgi:fructoselysine-6-P-deglycase FrlB-like protein
MLGAETFVIVYEGENATSELNLRMLRDIRDEGGRAELVGEESDFSSFKLPVVPQSVRPMVEALPAQMMTLALAAQIGREPGRFERATKVTTIE